MRAWAVEGWGWGWRYGWLEFGRQVRDRGGGEREGEVGVGRGHVIEVWVEALGPRALGRWQGGRGNTEDGFRMQWTIWYDTL